MFLGNSRSPCRRSVGCWPKHAALLLGSALLAAPALASGAALAAASPRTASAPAEAGKVAPQHGQLLAPTGDCIPPNCLYGQWPEGNWRPYSPDSAFNHKITDAVVEDRVDSAGIVADLPLIHRKNTPARNVPPDRRAPGNLGARVNGEDGWPTYYTSASDSNSRTVSVTCDPTATDDTFSTGGCPPNGQATYTQSMQIPLGAKPNGGVPVDGSNPAEADRHMTVVDQSAQPPREYDFWKVSPYGGPAGSPPAMTVAGMGWEPVNTHTGVTQVPPGNATAAMFGNLAGRIRAEELNAATLNADDPTHGVIPHAITISVECHDGQFTPPALSAPAAGTCDAGNAAPMGARLYLPSSVAINPAWHPWQKVLLRTIQQYGMYINDTGAGGVLFNLQKEGGLQYLAEGAPDNWWYAATGTHDLTLANNPVAVDTACKAHGWQSFGDGSKVLGCAAHFDVNSTNQVPLSIWTQLRVAALTVDRALRPASGPAAGGQPVTLHGTGMRGAVRVSFGGATVTGTASQDGTTVTVVPPGHAPGVVDVTVSTDVAGQAQPAEVGLPAAYRYTETASWQRLPGSAREVAVGADGSAWAIGQAAVAGGFKIYRWTGAGWATVSGGAVQITVGPDRKSVV